MLLLPSFCDDPSIFIILICHVAEAPEVNMDVASSSESMSKTTQALSKHQPRGIKGTVHPKMKILSSFTHPQVVPNLYECVCSEHKGRYFEECGKQSSSGAPLTSIVFFFPTIEVNGAPKQPDYKLSSEYLPLCSEQTHSYRFGTT